MFTVADKSSRAVIIAVATVRPNLSLDGAADGVHANTNQGTKDGCAFRNCFN